MPFTPILLVPRPLHSQSPRRCALHIPCAQRRVPNVCAILMCLHCSGCCNAVRVSGAADVQAMRMGTYQMVPGLTKQGRPVYRSSKGQYLYYWPASEAWRIGPDHNRVAAGVISKHGEATQCPTQPTVWGAYTMGSFMKRPIKVVCVTAGVVRRACAQFDMSPMPGAIISGFFSCVYMKAVAISRFQRSSFFFGKRACNHQCTKATVWVSNDIVSPHPSDGHREEVLAQCHCPHHQ